MQFNIELWLSLILFMIFITKIEGFYWTLLRRPYLYPGELLLEINEQITGLDCVRRCDELNCAHLSFIPEEWSQFEELGKIPGILFGERLEKTTLSLCQLFNLRSAGGNVATSAYLAKGVEVEVDGRVVVGKWLLASRIWDTEQGFDPKHFAPAPFFDMFNFTDAEFRKEVYGAVAPSCPASDSVLTSQGPSTLEDSYDTTTDGEKDSENTDEADHEETSESVQMTTTGEDYEADDVTAARKITWRTTHEESATTSDHDETSEMAEMATAGTDSDFDIDEVTTADITVRTTTEESAPITQNEETTGKVTTATEGETEDSLLETEHTDETSAAVTDGVVTTAAGATITTSRTKLTTTTEAGNGNGITLYSHICSEKMFNSFSPKCENRNIKRTSVFAKKITPEMVAAKCQMTGVREKDGGLTIVRTNNTNPIAYCAVSPCLQMTVPIGLVVLVDSDSLARRNVYEKVDAGQLCFVYQAEGSHQ